MMADVYFSVLHFSVRSLAFQSFFVILTVFPSRAAKIFKRDDEVETTKDTQGRVENGLPGRIVRRNSHDGNGPSPRKPFRSFVFVSFASFVVTPFFGSGHRPGWVFRIIRATTPTRSASEDGANAFPRWRFGLVYCSRWIINETRLKGILDVARDSVDRSVGLPVAGPVRFAIKFR